MKRLLLLLAASIGCTAEIIDRIAVVVGDGVITESEIVREMRLTAFLNGTPLDFSAAVKRATAERMVERRLMRNEINASPYPPPPPEAVEELLKEVRSRFASQADFQRELQRSGIAEADLKAHLLNQLITLRFVEFRFRPGVQIGDEEIGQYFDRSLAPELKKAHPGVEFSAGDYRAQAEEALVGERVNKASDAWLKEVRSHTRIEFRPEAFLPDPPRQEASK